MDGLSPLLLPSFCFFCSFLSSRSVRSFHSFSQLQGGRFSQTLGGRNRPTMPVHLARLSSLTDESLGLFCIVSGVARVFLCADALALTCGVS